MSLAWMILLAMVVEPGGDRPGSASEPAQSVGNLDLRLPTATLSHSLSAAKRDWRRAHGSWGWSMTGLEEFDTEEVDETWMVHLDVVTSVPGSWLGLAWCRSISEAKAFEGSAIPPPSYFPLRC